MPTIRYYLSDARSYLDFERQQLDQALTLATNSGYDQHWLDALNKALVNNHEATLHIANIQANIKHPAEPPFGLKPGITPPWMP